MRRDIEIADVNFSVDSIRSAMAYIETAKPRRFAKVRKSGGLLTAAVAKVMDDQIGRVGGQVSFEQLAMVMIEIAVEEKRIGRVGLITALVLVVELFPQWKAAPEEAKLDLCRGLLEAYDRLAAVTP